MMMAFCSRSSLAVITGLSVLSPKAARRAMGRRPTQGSSGAVSSSWSGGMREPPGLAQLWVVCARKEEDGGSQVPLALRPNRPLFSSQGSLQKLVPLAHASIGAAFAKPARTGAATGTMGQP